MSSSARAGKQWQAAADRLAALIPRSRLDPAVLAWAEAASPRARWGVGFSGGADSLALLLLVWVHWPRRRASLRALHFDHGLRGAESRADARFCAGVAAGLGLTLITEKWVDAPAGASEAEARSARLGFFQRQARIVWLGHQQDDIAESMLMRLARGSGAGGLAAPRPVQQLGGGRVHLRPLLTLKKAELVAALTAAEIPWREDSTNAGDAFFRNRVRQQVIPAWIETAQRDALAGAARSRRLLEEDDAALEAWLDSLSPIDRQRRLRLGTLRGRPRALLRRALHRWILVQRQPIRISSQAFEILLDALGAGKPTQHSIGREGFAVLRDDYLRYVRARKSRLTFHRSTN